MIGSMWLSIEAKLSLIATLGSSLTTGLSLMATISKSSLPTPHSGHTQSSGTSSQRVPGAIPSSGHPSASSYCQPQTIHSQILKGSLLVLTSGEWVIGSKTGFEAVSVAGG